MNDEMVPVSQNEMFCFCCAPENGCFNECCRDISQCLMPYDILRLKTRLGMTSHQFLKTYTSLHHGPESGLPMVEFKPDPATGHVCPFAGERGCAVYEDRPASCRLYPLARAVSRSRETGRVTEYYAVVREPHCKGFDVHQGPAVKDWIAAQDVGMYNAMNDKLMELVSLKNRIMPGKLQGAQADRFYLACYDLDTFRDEIFRNGLLDGVQVPPEILERVKTDDVALLDLGIAWIKDQLFGVGM
ncbi:MAG: YkgJ family cysteine cluster protein [Pseudomonadota bacterium]